MSMFYTGSSHSDGVSGGRAQILDKASGEWIYCVYWIRPRDCISATFDCRAQQGNLPKSLIQKLANWKVSKGIFII